MHYIDAADYLDLGAGVRHFKETPAPRTIVGKDIQNAMMMEIINVLLAAGISPSASGTADETAGWVQLLAAINFLVADNTVYNNITGITLLNESDVDQSAIEVTGKISYHKSINMVNLSLVFYVVLASNVNHLKFVLNNAYRPFNSDFDGHPPIPIGVCQFVSGTTWNPISDNYVNCKWSGTTLTFYLGNAQIAKFAPTTQSFASGNYRFGINYMYRRADI